MSSSQSPESIVRVVEVLRDRIKTKSYVPSAQEPLGVPGYPDTQKGGIQYVIATVTPRLDTLYFHMHTYLPVNVLYSERALKKVYYKENVMDLDFLKSEEQEIEKRCNNSINSASLNEALMKMDVLKELSCCF